MLPVPAARTPPRSPGSAPTPSVTEVRLPVREIVLGAVVTAALVLVAWGYAGVDRWCQSLAALLAAGALSLAVWPGDKRPGGAAPAWRRLVRLPVFWVGLFLLLYGLAQALNPAFVYRRAGDEWWLERLVARTGLPSGMNLTDAGFTGWDPLLPGFIAWALFCAVWTGLTRRRLILLLIGAIVLNGFLLAAFGLVQRAGGTLQIYGVRAVLGGDIFASFAYRNHAAAYFNLIAGAALALATRALWRERQDVTRRGPAVLFFLFAAMSLGAVVLTFSFGGILLMGLTIPTVALATFLRLRRAFPRQRLFGVGSILGLVVLAGIGSFAVASSHASWREHLEAKLAGGGFESVNSRRLAAQQGWAMWRDRPMLGWGVGCFRYGFTKYQHQVPALTEVGHSRYFWEHVHNDWLELLIEFGLAGTVLIWLGLGWCGWRLWRDRAPCLPAQTWLVAALLQLGVHALIDFPLHNPAILGTGAVLLATTMRWAELGTTGKPAPLTEASLKPRA